MPETVFLIREPAPITTPSPPSSGPLMNPSFGFSNRSSTPDEMFLNKPTGLPMILIDPTIANIYLFT